MKILFICNEYPPAPHGGIGSYTRFLAEALVERGHLVAVVGFDPTINHHKSQIENGVMVYRYVPPSGGFSKLRSFIVERYLLSVWVKKICIAFKPDIVESYDWGGPILTKPISGHFVVRMHGAHTVHNHTTGGKWYRSKLLRYMEWRNLRSADSLVAVSRFIADKAVTVFGINHRPVEVIHNSVDTNSFCALETEIRNPNRLLFVGRIHPYKGFDLLLKALEIVFLKKPQTYLDVVGPNDSKYAKALIAEIPQWMNRRIKFMGRVSNSELPAIYRSSNICILPSRVEAFAIVPLESMACGTPVIISSRIAASEVVDDRRDGLIADPFDAEGFARCILYALGNQRSIEDMRVNCLAKIQQQFSRDKIVTKNERFYLKCLG